MIFSIFMLSVNYNVKSFVIMAINVKNFVRKSVEIVMNQFVRFYNVIMKIELNATNEINFL